MSSKIKTSKIVLISQLEDKKEELYEAWSIITNLIDLMESKLPEKDIEEIRTQHRKWKNGECWINEY
ncbi:hypothetical protein [Prochlorococcus sp. MIT 0801]|uniref:hypothetical protein n=1 Tax=Prochlorococcus sp. MIT 0801 TaxID=1501269 RepID=UPI0004F8420A|nr:hypothetical protein [Prochlorococcus sp. MIT 0801]AIQ96162.1 hypothetical protein EW15_0070 [Prochlorococcus sp. MIT 0801]